MTRRFTTIKNVSAVRRLPRLGKIRLGVRVKKRQPDNRCKHDANGMCNYCTYPRETAYFVVPPEVEKVYGDEPTALDIMLPVDEQNVVFPQAYEMYGAGRGMKCTGDGERAMRMNEETGEMEERDCPCNFFESGQCNQRAHLAVILPKVSVGGIYQIDTSSYNSIVDVNSSLDYVRAMIGRFAMVPLKLKREPRETHHDGKKQTHYTMRIEFEGDINTLNFLRENTTKVLEGPRYVLPPPTHENPAFDNDGKLVDEDDMGLGKLGAEPGPATEAKPTPAESPTPPTTPPVHGSSEAAVTKDDMLRMVESAKDVEKINEVLDLARTLENQGERMQVQQACRNKVKALTAAVAGGAK